MPMCGWRSCGDVTFTRKERGSGLKKLARSSFSSVVLHRLTVLRLLTTEKIMAEEAKTMSEAWSLWDHVWADSRISYLAEPEGIEKDFRDLSERSSRSLKVWADSYLLAFASVAGLKLVTFDRALRAGQAEVLVL